MRIVYFMDGIVRTLIYYQKLDYYVDLVACIFITMIQYTADNFI